MTGVKLGCIFTFTFPISGINRKICLYRLQEKFGKQKMPSLSDAQPEIYYDVTVTQPGDYVLVLVYVTDKNQNTTTVEVKTQTQNSGSKGFATIYNCRYTMLCREVVLDREGRVAVFNFDTNFVKLILNVITNYYYLIIHISI